MPDNTKEQCQVMVRNRITLNEERAQAVVRIVSGCSEEHCQATERNRVGLYWGTEPGHSEDVVSNRFMVWEGADSGLSRAELEAGIKNVRRELTLSPLMTRSLYNEPPMSYILRQARAIFSTVIHFYWYVFDQGHQSALILSLSLRLNMPLKFSWMIWWFGF